jgi:hypothetical protein
MPHYQPLHRHQHAVCQDTVLHCTVSLLMNHIHVWHTLLPRKTRRTVRAERYDQTVFDIMLPKLMCLYDTVTQLRELTRLILQRN